MSDMPLGCAGVAKALRRAERTSGFCPSALTIRIGVWWFIIILDTSNRRGDDRRLLLSIRPLQ